MFTKEKESWKAALCLSTKGQKAARQRKAPRIKKDAYSKLRGVVAEGRDEVGVDVGAWEPRANHKFMQQGFGIGGLSLKREV
jgi:hypothetical protein